MADIYEVEESFWGVCLEPGKKYSQTVDKSVHVSMAAIDPHAKSSKELTSLWFERDSTSYIICTLGSSTFQQHLDLNFNEGENVSLYSKGTGTIHLTGYLHLDTDFASDDDFAPGEDGEEGSDDDDDFIDDEAEEEEEDNVLQGIKTEALKKRKLGEMVSKKVKKTKMEELDSDAEDKDEDDDDDEEMEEEKKSPVKASPQKEKKVEKKEEGGDGEKKKKKKKKKKKSQTGESEGEESKKTSPSETGAGDGSSSGGGGGSKRKVLQGGVVVETIKEGHGPEAVVGKNVKVYYTGKLESGKIFDSKSSGSPFSFRLGKKEVIAGWDIGVAGMKVGGKRKLTIPAKMGYGSQKLSGIPANSTLIFDVELKAVR